MKFPKINFSTEDELNYDSDEGPTSDDIFYGGLYLTPAAHTPFSFTLRRTSNPSQVTKTDYVTKLSKFTNMGCKVTNFVYEKNHTNDGFHIHGVIQIPKKFNLKRFRTRGWHIHLSEIYDRAGWDSYMAKEQILANQENDSEDPEPQIKMPTTKLF